MQKQATIQKQENSQVRELEQRREKFKKVDIKMTLETAKSSVELKMEKIHIKKIKNKKY